MKKIFSKILLTLMLLLVMVMMTILGTNSWFHYKAEHLRETHGNGVSGNNGMVVSAHPLASNAGIEILQKGGNAYDAAIAVQFALAVVYPCAGNIGGGGFLVFRTKKGEIGSLDFREKAPDKAHQDMYLDEKCP